MLREFVERKYAEDSEARRRYSEWLADANATRRLRNELVHGRWGIATSIQKVANVVGVPTSPNQREVMYSIPELQALVTDMQRLEPTLRELRERWPL